MGLVELLVAGLALAAVAGGGVAAAVVLGARNRRRRNQVVPGVPTSAPAAWAGAHTPEARLHRRLRAAVDAARSVADPDGALIQARVEVEQAALATDDHLVTLSKLSERERAGRLPEVRASVAAVEAAAATLADVANRGRGGALPAVEAALERATLLDEARRELDAGPEDLLDLGGTATPPVGSDHGEGEDEDGPPRPQALPG